MLTSDIAALTLLDSSTPELIVTVSSAGALPPDFRYSRPSVPFVNVESGGLTSLILSTWDCAAAASPSGTTDIVPSPPMVVCVDGGTCTGPDSDSTCNPVEVTKLPSAVTCRS